MEITEIISEIDGNGVEILKGIFKIPVISFGKGVSSHAGIYEESEEI